MLHAKRYIDVAPFLEWQFAKPIQTFSSKICCVVGLNVKDTGKDTGKVYILSSNSVLIYSTTGARPR